MIEKLKIIMEDDDIDMSVGAVNQVWEDTPFVRKINELIDTVNEIKQYLDWDEISGAGNWKFAKNANKSDLEEAPEGFPGWFKSNKDEPLADAVMQDVKRINQNVNFGQPEVKESHKIRSTNERLRKALDKAKSVLENISSFYKSLILANSVSDINWDIVAKNFAKHSDEALEQIKTITETRE